MPGLVGRTVKTCRPRAESTDRTIPHLTPPQPRPAAAAGPHRVAAAADLPRAGRLAPWRALTGTRHRT
ncbi:MULTISPECIES: hypothetical protein [Haloferacaceae]|uniref:Uncharacterized protein n=1 Tax=Halorubrum glutamatedens TaxID=2707018 RepID=A0ABD5QLV0_9EURY|nr:hypothetical protein [Halobellus captivus]